MEQLSKDLEVDPQIIRCAIASPSICADPTCVRQALLSNRSLCAWHCKKFANLEVGDLYLGPEFMKHSKDQKRCCCNSNTCKKIGYPCLGSFSLPSAQTKAVLRGKYLQALGMKECDLSSAQRHFVAWWHFKPEHRSFNKSTKKWELTNEINSDTTYRDEDVRWDWPCPPPTNPLKRFIEIEAAGGRTDPKKKWFMKPSSKDDIPDWARVGFIDTTAPTVDSDPPSEKKQKTNQITPLAMKKAASASEQTEENHRLSALLGEQKKETDTFKKKCAQFEEQVAQLKKDLKKLKDEYDAQSEQVEALKHSLTQQAFKFLRYSDLRDGVLKKKVPIFTFFNTVEANDDFLDMLNMKHSQQDSGVLTRMKRYSRVKKQERADLEANQAVSSEKSDTSDKHKPRSLGWKDEYLLWNTYVHCGWTYEQISALFGVGTALISDIIHTWTNLLDRGLGLLFPIPSRSEMLSAYPSRFVATHGHARVWALMDCTELGCQVPKGKEAHSVCYSSYKGHSTVKFVVLTDSIGTTWGDGLPDGFGGSISDPFITRITDIIAKNFPAGTIVEVDKGFLIENECAAVGVGVMRPQKRKSKDRQQSAINTRVTQKVGNTRIVVEQVNGQAKLSCRFMQSDVGILMTDLVSMIFRVVFLLQNFKVPFVIGNRSGSKKCRPCKAAIRYCGHSDIGLFDARPFPELWATNEELTRHAQLSRDNPKMSSLDISLLILKEEKKT